MNSKRRTVIAGNWKMNFTPAEATAFINEIKPMVAGKDACDVIFCAPYVTIAAAQAADELLSIQGVRASFVIFRVGNEIAISARSLGDVNVQILLEEFGGGGHLNMAGAQIKNSTTNDVRKALIRVLDEKLSEATKKNN